MAPPTCCARSATSSLAPRALWWTTMGSYFSPCSAPGPWASCVICQPNSPEAGPCDLCGMSLLTAQARGVASISLSREACALVTRSICTAFNSISTQRELWVGLTARVSARAPAPRCGWPCGVRRARPGHARTRPQAERTHLAAPPTRAP
jgi:hypothetical protein